MTSIKEILEKYKVVAVVGISRNPSKDSHMVAKYLKDNGYEIIPINPYADEILNKKCYPSLLDLPEDLKKKIEVVDIFRPPEEVEKIVDQAIQLKRKYGTPYVIWMQLGIENEKAAQKAKANGMIVIQNKCMKIEHSALF